MSGVGRWLRVLPDGERAEDAMRAAASGGSGWVDGRSWVSLRQLLDRLDVPGNTGLRRCDPLLSRWLVWDLVRTLGPGPFGSFAQEPAFARAAVELFSDIRLGCGTAEVFREAVQRLPVERQRRGLYLAELFLAYERRLAERKLVDRMGELRVACRLLEGGLPAALAGIQRIEFAGIHDFPPLRRQLVTNLARACKKAGVAFRLEVPSSGEMNVDIAVDGVFRAYEEAEGFEDVELHKEDLVEKGRPLAGLGKWLFSGAPKGAGRDLSERVERWSAATAREEARVLAKRVAALVTSGVAPESIAIVYRELGQEAEWVQEALEAHGIPGRLRLGQPLLATAAGRLALELPSLCENQFPCTEVARLLSSRYFPALARICPEAPARWLRLAGVRDDGLGAEGPRGAYEVRLEKLRVRLSGRDARGARELAKLQEAAGTLIRLGNTMPPEGRLSQLLKTWWSALDALGLPDALRRAEGSFSEESELGRSVLTALARDQATGESLRALVQGLDSAFREAGIGSAPMSRALFQRWLVDASKDFPLQSKGKRNGAVRILDAREMPARCFSHVLLAGVTDGRFPGRSEPHAVFPDEDRAAINRALGKPLFELSSGEFGDRLPRRLAEDRLLFYVSLAAATERVLVSFARRGADGREQIPSAFFTELGHLLEDDVRAVPWRAVPTLEEVWTESELRQTVAFESLAPSQLRSRDPEAPLDLLELRFANEPWREEAKLRNRIEVERLRFFSRPEVLPGPYSGNVARADTVELLQRALAFDAERPLSASMLGRYGQCGFAGFLAHLVRLEGPREVEEEMDAAGEGTFWHHILERLFPLLREHGLLGVPPEQVPDSLIDQALDASIADAERQLHTGHSALWALSRQKARAMVRRVLSAEGHGLPFEGHVPWRTELSFGKSDSPDGWQEVRIPGVNGEPPIYLEGKIDRLDKGGSGLAVLDYKRKKLGSAREAYDALLTTEFQLPLYLYAARAAGHEGPLQAGWLSLRSGDAALLDSVLENGEQTLDELLEVEDASCASLASRGVKNLPNAVRGLVGQLRKGLFAPRAADCGYCAFGAVCRTSVRTFDESGGHEPG